MLKLSADWASTPRHGVHTANAASQVKNQGAMEPGESQRSMSDNFNYRFGSSDVKSARRRTTGLEDENGRIKVVLDNQVDLVAKEYLN